MHVEPQKEHQWLQQLVGDWTYQMEASMKPGEPPDVLKGAEIVRSVGDIWIVAEGSFEMPDGGVAKTVLTLGFDPVIKKFVGSWIGSMMTHFWRYEGTLDASQKILTLSSDGPAMDGSGEVWQYRDIITIKSDSERTLTGNVLGKDGQWSEMMLCTFRRA